MALKKEVIGEFVGLAAGILIGVLCYFVWKHTPFVAVFVALILGIVGSLFGHYAAVAIVKLFEYMRN